MEGVQARPKHAQVMSMVIGLAALSGIALGVPVLSPVCAVLMPLFSCPLIKHRQEWLGWVCAVLPGLSVLARGVDPVLAFICCLPALVPLAADALIPIKQRVMPRGIWLHCATSGLSLLIAIACLSWRLGGPLATTLPPIVTAWVSESDSAWTILYRLAAAGLVSVPDLPSEALMPLLSGHITGQMLLSLERTVMLLIQSLLPSLFMSAALLVGLFTQLRIERLNGVMLVVERDEEHPLERKTRVVAPPGLRMLALSKMSRITLAVMLVLSLLLYGQGSYPTTLALLLQSAAYTVFQVVGAAVIVFRLTKRFPDKELLSGLAAGAAYVFLPTLLLLLGLCDQWFHFRSASNADEE